MDDFDECDRENPAATVELTLQPILPNTLHKTDDVTAVELEVTRFGGEVIEARDAVRTRDVRRR